MPVLLRRDVRFHDLLGSGYHSRVYRGEYCGRIVALKVRRARRTEFTTCAPDDPDGRYLDDDEAMAVERMLIAEAEILSRLPKNPHVVGLVGIIADDDPGGPILVLDLASRYSAAELFAGDVRERAKKSWVRRTLFSTCNAATASPAPLLSPRARLAGRTCARQR